MCFLHGLMAELSVKTNIVKVLLCDLVNNSLTPTGGKNYNKISFSLHIDQQNFKKTKIKSKYILFINNVLFMKTYTN